MTMNGSANRHNLDYRNQMFEMFLDYHQIKCFILKSNAFAPRILFYPQIQIWLPHDFLQENSPTFLSFKIPEIINGLKETLGLSKESTCCFSAEF